VHNPAAKDPTWEELKSFLSQDNTDRHLYVNGSFVCGDFAEMLHNNAENAGISAAYVIINLSSVSSHALNAFNTTDDGLVYIDDTGLSAADNYTCSADKIVAVAIGNEYTPVSIFPCAGRCITWNSLGIVTNLRIQW
jgi:hypothetical protein